MVTSARAVDIHSKKYLHECVINFGELLLMMDKRKSIFNKNLLRKFDFEGRVAVKMMLNLRFVFLLLLQLIGRQNLG